MVVANNTKGMTNKEIKDLDDICEYVLKKLANRSDGEHWAIYTTDFLMPNGENVSDNGFDPLRIVGQFKKYGLSKPLYKERCELTDLGIEIGQGIGFIKHKENEENKKRNKETIEKRKSSNINFDYFVKRPYYFLLLVLLILSPFGLNKCSNREESNKTDTERTERSTPQHKNTKDSTDGTNRQPMAIDSTKADSIDQ